MKNSYHFFVFRPIFLKLCHSPAGKLEIKKNSQKISALPRERPHWELRNEPPLDGSELTHLNPFMASHSPDLIQRLAIKGIWSFSPDLSSGGSFRSSGWGRSRSTLENPWEFLPAARLVLNYFAAFSSSSRFTFLLFCWNSLIFVHNQLLDVT